MADSLKTMRQHPAFGHAIVSTGSGTHQRLRDTREIFMKELDVIELPDGRRGMVVYVSADAQRIIVEVESDLIDYVIEENRLKEISRMTVGPEDLVSRLIKGKQAADRGETTDVTGWTREQIAERFFT
jgi:hypothetical protein